MKMQILNQSKPTLLILKIKTIKNPSFIHCMFIIHKNGNKTSIQPILKSSSTSFMFNNIFCEMKGKKVIQWGGNGGTVKMLVGSEILVFTWISKYITWISKQ